MILIIEGHAKVLSDGSRVWRTHDALEAISKLPQGDKCAGDVEEGSVDINAVLVADDQAAEVAQPGHGPLDDPASPVAAELCLMPYYRTLSDPKAIMTRMTETIHRRETTCGSGQPQRWRWW